MRNAQFHKLLSLFLCSTSSLLKVAKLKQRRIKTFEYLYIASKQRTFDLRPQMQFLVRVFGGVDIISGKLNYELQTVDPETGTLLIKT